jgi:type VI protein secretion system component Hcp
MKTVESLVFVRAQSIREPLPLVEIDQTEEDGNGTELTVLSIKLTDAAIGTYDSRWDPTQMASVETLGLSFKKFERKYISQ